MGFPGGAGAKYLPVNAGYMWIQSLGQEDPLEKGMETHSSILAWRIPWTEVPGRLQSMGSQSRTQLKQLNTHTHIHAMVYKVEFHWQNIFSKITHDWKTKDLLSQQNGRSSLIGRFKGAESTHIYDPVAGRYFGVMKKYLHTTRHSM